MRRPLAIVAILLLLLPAAPPVRADRIYTGGFETNDPTSEGVFQINGSQCAITTTAAYVHTGTYGLRCNGLTIGNNFFYAGGLRGFNFNFGSGATVQPGFWFKVVTTGSAEGEFLNLGYSGDGANLKFNLTTSRTVKLYDIGGANCGTTSALAANTWQHITIAVTVSDTVGAIDFRADGTSIGSCSNIDSKGTGNLNQLMLGNSAESAVPGTDVAYDDFKINDTAGSNDNSYPNSDGLYPSSPDGDSSVTWTKTGANCSGTSNYDCTNDWPGAPDDGSGYIASTGTLGDFDKFSLSDLSATGSWVISAIFGRVRCTSNSSSPSQIKLDLWDEGGTKTSSAAVDSAAGGAGTYSNFHALSWYPSGKTVTNFASFSGGVETFSDVATRERQVTALQWLVEAHAPTVTTPQVKISGAAKISGAVKKP